MVNGSNGVQRPPGMGQSKKARKRRAARAQKQANVPKSRVLVRAKPGFQPKMGAMLSAPAAMQRRVTQSAPKMNMSGNGQICLVTHREYVAEVAGATSWTTTSYVIQPALQSLFNWLAPVAGNFEKYRFRRLRFCYETESPTSQAGSVVLSIDYDALDAAPASKQAALSYKSSVRSAPWQECCLECDLSRDDQRDLRFTRSGSVPSGADQKLYDVGNLFVGVQNSSGATGELWVEYTVELHTPQQTQQVGARSSATTGLTASALVGSDAAYVTNSNIGWALTDSSTFTCTIAGSYLFTVNIVGTTMVGTSLNVGAAGTATVNTSVCAVDSAATSCVGYSVITAQVGQTYKPAITSAASVTSVSWRMARFNAV